MKYIKFLHIVFANTLLFICLEASRVESSNDLPLIECSHSLPPEISESNKLYNHLTIVKKITIGSHESYLLIDNKEALYFWKKASEKESLLGEIAGTEMANYITSGLVPVAQEMKLLPPQVPSELSGSVQPYIDMEPGAFDEKNFEKGNFDPKKLTQMQKNQLFVHMIADRLIANYDTHSAQFGISQGNIIGFDKGDAFKYFAATNIPYLAGIPSQEEPKTFNPKAYWVPLGNDRPVYSAFADYLKNSPQVLQQIWTSQTVQDALTRCRQLTKEDVRHWLQQYLTVRVNDNNKQEQFIEQVYQRVKSTEAEIKQYFSI